MLYKAKQSNKIVVIIGDDIWFIKIHIKLLPVLLGYKIKVFDSLKDSLVFFNSNEAKQCALVFIKYKHKCMVEHQDVYLYLKKRLRPKLRKKLLFTLVLERNESYCINHNWSINHKLCHVTYTPIHRKKLNFILADSQPRTNFIFS